MSAKISTNQILWENLTKILGLCTWSMTERLTDKIFVIVVIANPLNLSYFILHEFVAFVTRFSVHSNGKIEPTKYLCMKKEEHTESRFES